MKKNTKLSAALQKILRSGIISWIVIIAIWGLGSLAYDEYFPSAKGALLIDMNGNEVKLWAGLGGFPNKILPGGYVMGTTGAREGKFAYQDQLDLVQVDWDGHIVWKFDKGLPGEGDLLVFDNGGEGGYGVPNPASPTGVNNAHRDYSRVLQFNPVTLEITWQYTPLEHGCFLFTDASKFYSSYISSAQRLPNGNTLITEGSDGHLIEVTPDHEIVWEYINPYFNNMFGKFTNNMIYRSYRVPYEWIPQLEVPDEKSIEPIDVSTFRVPGSPVGAGVGQITTVDGVDPNARTVTGMANKKADENERLDFCVASINKNDIK